MPSTEAAVNKEIIKKISPTFFIKIPVVFCVPRTRKRLISELQVIKFILPLLIFRRRHVRQFIQ